MTQSRSQIDAMRTIDTYSLRRVKGGWQAPGSKLVTLKMVTELKRAGLAREFFAGAHNRLELSATGRIALPERKQA